MQWPEHDDDCSRTFVTVIKNSCTCTYIPQNTGTAPRMINYMGKLPECVMQPNYCTQNFYNTIWMYVHLLHF